MKRELALLGCLISMAHAERPKAVTEAATKATTTSVRLNATVHPGGEVTKVYFQTGDALNNKTPAQEIQGNEAVPVFFDLTHPPGVSEQYIAVAANASGTSKGQPRDFTTSAVDLGQGLYAYWPLDGALGDAIGSFHGVLKGTSLKAEFVPGRAGKGLRLNGVDQFVEVTGGDFSHPVFTLSFWTCLEKKDATLFWQGHAAWHLDYSEKSGALIRANTSSDGWPAEAPVELSLKPKLPGEQMFWRHVCMTSDRFIGPARLYVDGVLLDESASFPAVTSSVLPLHIGGRPGQRRGVAQGAFDEIAFWKRELSDEEIGRIAKGASLAGLLPDADSDGLPDAWERNHSGGVLKQGNDADLDGLSDEAELGRGTSPVGEDSDGDGLPDRVETGTGVWVDAGNTGTSPVSPDTDTDGIPDGEEDPDDGLDPNDSDSDDDGFSDGDEKRLVGGNPADHTFRPDIGRALKGYWPWTAT